MSMITTEDGTEIFYKDWGSAQPIVFHHGWMCTTHAEVINQDLLAFVKGKTIAVAGSRQREVA